MIPEVNSLIGDFDKLGYTVEEELATVFQLMMKLEKPLLLEGPPGVGKTESAKILAAYRNTELIRLQCYEGLDVNTSIYEWNYQKQLLSIKINEKSGLSEKEKEDIIFSDEFLLKRPLLKAITAGKSPVLLIDEIDRADEEFEAFLLELLSDYQISIPEMGTVKAKYKPLVILTSNRTRELSDALKRRCLYHWITYPDFNKELKIVRDRFPGLNESIAENLVRFVERLRQNNLQKQPGVAETIDWAHAILSLQVKTFDKDSIIPTIGCILKSESDIRTILSEGISNILEDINQ